MGWTTRTAAWRAATTALLIVAAACGGDGASDVGASLPDAERTTSSDTTSTTQVVPCVAGDLDPRQLLPVVVEDVSGFTQASDDVGNTGPSDLAKAISDDGEPDAERVLKENGFRAGYQRLWTNDIGDELVLFVYQFCMDDGAERYADRTLDLFQRAQLPTQPVVGTTVGTGFTVATDSMRGLWLWETSGTVLVQVIAYTERLDDVAGQLQQANDLLLAQLDKFRPSATDAM